MPWKQCHITDGRLRRRYTPTQCPAISTCARRWTAMGSSPAAVGRAEACVDADLISS